MEDRRSLFSTFIVASQISRSPSSPSGSSTATAPTALHHWFFGNVCALVALIVTVLTGQFQGVIVLALILAYLAFFCSCVGLSSGRSCRKFFRTTSAAPDDRSGAHAVGRERLGCSLLPLAFNRVGKCHFRFLAAMCLVQAIFTWFFVPKPRTTAEEIEQFWLDEAGK